MNSRRTSVPHLIRAASFLVLTGYDRLSLRYVRKPLPYRGHYSLFAVRRSLTTLGTTSTALPRNEMDAMDVIGVSSGFTSMT